MHNRGWLRRAAWLALVSMAVVFAGCAGSPPTVDLLAIQVSADAQVVELELPPGITVEKAVELAGFTLNPLDRVAPPSYSIISEDAKIEIFRVTEAFESEEVVLPFETQTMKNETLPEGQTLLVQAGVNGVQENTYRVLFEDGAEVSRTLIRQELRVETRPEIVMVGVQTPYTEVTFSGRIVYLTAGNAWVMEKSSGERRPIVTSGDLDGRVFSLSPEGGWLLFTRRPTSPEDASSAETAEKLNELWMVKVTAEESEPVYLRVDNIALFADWRPGQPLTIAYSTVEPRATAPGWQANNDLLIMSVNENGAILRREEIVAVNSGGLYGWWGTEFCWSGDGSWIAYARPDSIGIIDPGTKEVIPLLNLLPYQTRGSWAWVPGVAISPDGELLYYVEHTPSGIGETEQETSQDFSLSALPLSSEYADVLVVPLTGMFASPVVAPDAAPTFSVAYLQAIFPDQSETSGYHLYIMDQDGSNRVKVFPPEGASGLDPQKVAWGPVSGDSSTGWISLVYQGNLWLVDVAQQKAYQLTGDGSISRIDWK